METIHDRIKKIIGSVYGKQKVLAKKLGVSEGVISHWKNGTRIPDDKSRALICSLCGISRAWLDDGIGDMREKPILSVQEPRSTYETTSDTIDKLNAQITALKAEVETYKREAYIYQGQLAECRLHLEDVKKEKQRGLERQLSNSINSNAGIL